MKSTGNLKYFDPETQTWVDLGVVRFDFGAAVPQTDFAELELRVAAHYASQAVTTLNGSVRVALGSLFREVYESALRAPSYPGAGDPPKRSKHFNARLQRARAKR